MPTLRNSIVVASLIAAGLLLWHTAADRPRNESAAHEQVRPRETLEEYLSASYGERWTAMRARLLEEEMLTESALSAQIDPNAIAPWASVRQRLASEAAGEFDIQQVRSSLVGWRDAPLETNLQRLELDLGARPLRGDERKAVETIVVEHALVLDQLADAAIAELRALVRREWEEDAVLRVPIVEVAPENSAGPPPSLYAQPTGRRLNYRTSITIDGWSVLVAPDSSRSDMLNDVLNELAARRADRSRALKRYLASRV
jgi:hypothetical protein